jgi:hypothetical protein
LHHSAVFGIISETWEINYGAYVHGFLLLFMCSFERRVRYGKQA